MAILSLVLLAVLAAACLIACITCIRSGCRGIGGSRKKKQTGKGYTRPAVTVEHTVGGMSAP